MVKRLIFDLDNTLIMWKDEYILALKNVLDDLDVTYNNDKLHEIDSVLVEYEKHHDIYEKEMFLKYVNDCCNIKLPINFVDKLIIEQGNCYEEDVQLVDTIRYLKTKYELMLLSNWFTETQKLRLKGLGILDCFSIVSGGDERLLKPNLKAFNVCLENVKPEECIMIGDSLKHDIIPASTLGMNVIWVTDKQNETYTTVDKVYSLKKML